jgi:hypothetical protein
MPVCAPEADQHGAAIKHCVCATKLACRQAARSASEGEGPWTAAGHPAACQIDTAAAILMRDHTWAVAIKAPVQPGRQFAHHPGVQAVHLQEGGRAERCVWLELACASLHSAARCKRSATFGMIRRQMQPCQVSAGSPCRRAHPSRAPAARQRWARWGTRRCLLAGQQTPPLPRALFPRQQSRW